MSSLSPLYVNSLQSIISGAVTQGDDYYIMVDGFAALQGNFDLAINCMDLSPAAPTVGSWGLILLAVILVGGALLALRRMTGSWPAAPSH